MKILEIIQLMEAAHDLAVQKATDALISQFPQLEEKIRTQMALAKNLFSNKQDKMLWLTAQLMNQNYDPERTDYFLNTLRTHYYGQSIPGIDNFVFPENMSPDEILSKFDEIETEFKKKQNQEKGVDPQPGDYVLFEFAGGIKWWWIDRAHCSEEGRSGKHCGNFIGKNIPDLRILSLRNARNQVILTFIREPDGTLGEMKAKGNQKPNERYHPHIMKLLLWDKITGISGMGYLPDMNFSVFDLDEEQLNYLDQHKPKLISDQAGVTPFELLKLDIPVNIKQKYLKYAEQKQPSIKRLINSNTYEQWYNEIINQEDLIFYLPSEYITKFPNYLDTLINQAKKMDNVLKIPRVISRNFDYMKKIVAEIPRAIGLTNQYAKGYKELCEIAVTKDYNVMSLINEESRTIELYTHAVKTNGWALEIVPEDVKLKYPKICEDAFANTPNVFGLIPERFRKKEMFADAVIANWQSLALIPESMRTKELCKLAVDNHPLALIFVPQTIQEKYPDLFKGAVKQAAELAHLVPPRLQSYKLYKLAVENYSHALNYIYQTTQEKYPDLAEIAVKHFPEALAYVTESLKTYELCKLAVTQNGKLLKFVPQTIQEKYPDLAEIAVKQNAKALPYIPKQLRTYELCKLAVEQDGIMLFHVPKTIQEKYPELNEIAVKQNAKALAYIPRQLRTYELYKLAIEQDETLLDQLPNHVLSEFPELSKLAR